MGNSIIWLRRDLRIHDHTSFSSVLEENNKILPIFVFDQEILSRFNDKNDRRLSFLADSLFSLNQRLKSFGGEILIIYGRGSDIIAEISRILKIDKVFAIRDYEQQTIERDNIIKDKLEEQNIEFTLQEDDVIMPVSSILKKDKKPYKVFAAYKRQWKSKITEANYINRKVDFKKVIFTTIDEIRDELLKNNIKIVNPSTPKTILKDINYEYNDISKYWGVDDCESRLKFFVNTKIKNYKNLRDYMGQNATSMLSPYIRFGRLSIRECFRIAEKKKAEDWINELIWRDFYKMILYHFPYSSKSELQQIYKDKIKWENDDIKFNAWCEGRTGFPLIDAAMRQLKTVGWMHNRMRMITASFLTKHLLIDWRKGEEYFAQYLMDYDLSSNVGGWQWSASTGNDPQPYFRIFNPTVQAKTYDNMGKYIKKYVLELKNIQVKNIFEPKKYNKFLDYPDPIVEHKEARIRAIEIFKKARMER